MQLGIELVNVAEIAVQLGIECRERGRDSCATGNLSVGNVAGVAVQLGIECRERGRDSCVTGN